MKIHSFQKTVTAAGTREPLVTDKVECISVSIKALAGNGGTIYLGGGAVDSSNGKELTAGEAEDITVPEYLLRLGVLIEIGSLWIDSSVNGEGVSVSYMTEN